MLRANSSLCRTEHFFERGSRRDIFKRGWAATFSSAGAATVKRGRGRDAAQGADAAGPFEWMSVR
jgi:hypothetical protein